MTSVLRDIENSAYGRFGIYLHEQHFWGTFMLALVLHLGGYALYQMLPDYEVEEIPVRVLNIKFGGIELPQSDGERTQISTDISAMEHLQPKSGGANAAVSDTRTSASEAPSNAAGGLWGREAVEDKEEKPQPAQQQPKEKQPEAEPQRREKVEQKTAEKVEKVSPRSKPKPRPVAERAASQSRQESRQQRYYREMEQFRGEDSGSVYGNSTQDSATIRKRYTQLLSLWIEKHKIYPAEARAAGLGGQVLLRMRINRQGTIVRYYLEKATGHASIDRAVNLIVDAANPVPPVPDDYPDRHNYLEFIIPINFKP